MTAGMWDANRSYTRMLLEDVALELKVGIADWERHPDRRQRVLVTVECFMHQKRHDGDGIDSVLDYDRVYRYLRTWPERPHTDLLETLAQDLVDFCFTDQRVEACRVFLRKPQVYPDATPGIEFYRCR